MHNSNIQRQGVFGILQNKTCNSKFKGVFFNVLKVQKFLLLDSLQEEITCYKL